jgi:hypothetical protein
MCETDLVNENRCVPNREVEPCWILLIRVAITGQNGGFDIEGATEKTESEPRVWLRG